jgi:hypothetical protein
MKNQQPEDPIQTLVVEVIVYRHGTEIARQPCESEEEAAAVVAHWEEERGVTCEVVDLSAGPDAQASEVDWSDRNDYRDDSGDDTLM